MTTTAIATERRLATIEHVTSIHPIDGADAIERARIRGWDVVVKKGELAPGDLVVYIEIDALLPIADERFAFLAPRGVRTQDGVEGHVLKTARLRGVYSQGIAFPISQFLELADAVAGDDVTGRLGIVRWDPPLPADLAGVIRGHFPSRFRKTDEERLQNLAGMLDVEGVWTATEKIDGTSMSVMILDGEEHVAGRNYDIEDVPGNTMWETARQLGLFDLIDASFPAPGQDVAVQGELFGPGIQGNPLHLKEHRFCIFTIQVDGMPLPRDSWPHWAKDLSVPIHDLPFPKTLDEALDQVEKRPSLIPGAQGNIEGVVWRRANGERLPDGSRASFKVISRAYTMKHDR